MKKMLCRLMVMCFLALALAAVAQSGDNMKQDQTQHCLAGKRSTSHRATTLRHLREKLGRIDFVLQVCASQVLIVGALKVDPVSGR